MFLDVELHGAEQAHCAEQAHDRHGDSLTQSDVNHYYCRYSSEQEHCAEQAHDAEQANIKG